MDDHDPDVPRPMIPVSAPSPADPVAAVVPGVFLTFVGFLMLTSDGPLPLAWAAVALGQALLLVGAVAWGVAWALELHASRGGGVRRG